MPNCIVSSVGAYQISGDQIVFGLLKSKLSSGCPAGMSVKDKDPVQNRFRIEETRIEGNDLIIDASAGFFCPQASDTLELRLRKNSRWSPVFRH